MFLEIAQIEVKPGHEAEFEAGVAKAAPLFKRAKGCSGLELQRTNRR
jgi:heme-degrading monooxygenase HmoA